MAGWISGGLMGILAFIGLLAASRAKDPMFSFFGYLLFLFGIVVIFSLIHQYTGRQDDAS